MVILGCYKAVPELAGDSSGQSGTYADALLACSPLAAASAMGKGEALPACPLAPERRPVVTPLWQRGAPSSSRSAVGANSWRLGEALGFGKKCKDIAKDTANLHEALVVDGAVGPLSP